MKHISDNIITWENQGEKFRIITQNFLDYSKNNEFCLSESKAVVQISLQKHGSFFNFLMYGSLWNTIKVEKHFKLDLITTGGDPTKYLSIYNDAKILGLKI